MVYIRIDVVRELEAQALHWPRDLLAWTHAQSLERLVGTRHATVARHGGCVGSGRLNDYFAERVALDAPLSPKCVGYLRAPHRRVRAQATSDGFGGSAPLDLLGKAYSQDAEDERYSLN